uniref:Uncharacterized protein n=1 Tax=Arundo donax TaxID=35708 RepID=A0A0A9E065_ARUDO
MVVVYHEEMRPFIYHLPAILPHPAEMLTGADLKPHVCLLPCLKMLAPEPDQLPRRSAALRARPPEEHEH